MCKIVFLFLINSHCSLEEASAKNKQSDIYKKFRSILFAINPDNHQDMSDDIENFLAKMKNKYGCDEMNDKHLMKINLQAYPVTNTFRK